MWESPRGPGRPSVAGLMGSSASLARTSKASSCNANVTRASFNCSRSWARRLPAEDVATLPRRPGELIGYTRKSIGTAVRLISSLAGRDRPSDGRGLGLPACRLACGRQLDDRGPLSLAKQRHQDVATVGKFDGVMVTVRNVLVDRAQFSNSETGLPCPDPAAVVSHVFGERQLGPRQDADGDVGLAFGCKPSRRGATESRRDQGFAGLRGTARYGVQAIVTHRIAPRSR